MFGFNKKTPEQKMEQYVKRGDWNSLNQYVYGSHEEKIALARACAGSTDNSCIDILLRLINSDDDDVKIATCETLQKVGTDHVTAELQQVLMKTPKENTALREALSATMQKFRSY